MKIKVQHRVIASLVFAFGSGAFQISLPATTTRCSSPRSTILESSADKSKNGPSTEDGGVPSMDWLTNSLSSPTQEQQQQDANNLDFTKSPFMEEHAADGDLGDVPIPTTGISVSDEMEQASKDQFFTEVVPMLKGMAKGVRAAQIVTTATAGSFEPVRYVVGLSKNIETPGDKESEASGKAAKATDDSFVMIDVPPYSNELKQEIDNYMNGSDKNGRLAAILVTTRDNIHYNEAPGVFAIRRADLLKWQKAYPDTAIIAYRLDIPRDCRESITQRLDGYGPFALQEEEAEDEEGLPTTNLTFVESGRPLTYEEWEFDVTENVFAGKRKPPDDDEKEDGSVTKEQEEEALLYTPEAIRAREAGKRILAVYTPGRSYGSVSYVFPEIQLCASGYSIPVEDSRSEDNLGMESTGPALDCRGYITTSRAGISRQMESTRELVNNYVDRFNVILPSRGDPFFLDGNAEERKGELLDIVDQYEKIGKIYEQLGITNYDADEDGM